MTVVTVDDIHTPEMIADETLFCIGDHKPMVTLAGFMRLCQGKSPYVFGGVVSDQDIVDAAHCVDNWCGLHGAELDDALRKELAAVSRAFEIIQTDEKSVIPPFGPEWLTNFMAAVADAMPSLTPNMMLHKTPMVLLVHLAAASHRKNGGTTRRPDNAEAVFMALDLIDQTDDPGHGEQPVDDVGQI